MAWGRSQKPLHLTLTKREIYWGIVQNCLWMMRSMNIFSGKTSLTMSINPEVILGYSGYCKAGAHHAVKGEPRGLVKFHALWAIIKHPSEGLILFDTGYTSRFHTATKSWPNKIYARMTPVVIDPEDELKSQLARLGHSHLDVLKVIISHFHADHVGGLRDFPNAQIITSRRAFEHTLKTPKWRGFTKGILHDLIPDNWTDRLCIVEDNFHPKKNKYLGEGRALFGDDSLQLYNLPGHAAGQTGLLIQSTNGPLLLIADACWDLRAVTEGKLPNPIVRLFFDDWTRYLTAI